jgi:hypothetical protein
MMLLVGGAFGDSLFGLFVSFVLKFEDGKRRA